MRFTTSSPIGDEVSTNGSETEVNPIPSFFIFSSNSQKSFVLLVMRSMRNTMILSICPCSQCSISRL